MSPTPSEMPVNEDVIEDQDFLLPDGTPGPILSIGPGAGLQDLPQHTDYKVDVKYVWSPGVMQMPVAGPDGTPARVVKKHAMVCKKIVDWTAERFNTWPVLPHWDSGSTNEVLTHAEATP